MHEQLELFTDDPTPATTPESILNEAEWMRDCIEATALVRAAREMGRDGELGIDARRLDHPRSREVVRARQYWALAGQASLWRSFFGQ